MSVLADIDLDLREATIERQLTSVRIFVLFGNVDVYVPDAINVDVGGLAMFGHRRDWGDDMARPDAPTVRVRALGLFGTIDVWRVPADVRGTHGDVIRQIEGRLRARGSDRRLESG